VKTAVKKIRILIERRWKEMAVIESSWKSRERYDDRCDEGGS
jgi:hypothetical protein